MTPNEHGSPHCRLLSLVATTSLFLLVVCPRSEAQCAHLRAGSRPAVADSIGLVAAKGTPNGLLEGAVESWRTCRQYGRDFPRFVVGATGTRTVEVEYVHGSSGARSCGSFQRRKIKLFGSALDPSGRPRRCGDPATILAHELGHVLGLVDQYGSGSCSSHIMSQTPPAGRDRRRVEPAECATVAARWAMEADRLASVDDGAERP